jgi:uncharacterized membrane protein YdjX (TVP38/TMEM64 family)
MSVAAWTGVRDGGRGPARSGAVAGTAALAVVVALIAVWRWTPLAVYADAQELLALAASLRELPGATLIVIGVFVLAGLVAFPVTILTMVTVLTFGPMRGIACALAGAVTSAVIAYLLGAALGRDRVRRMAGERIDRISRRLGRRGVLTVVAVRVVPLAPFTIVNLAAGASHIGLRDFVIGTLLGMTPGLLVTSFFADRLHAALAQPGPGDVIGLVAALAVIAALGVVLLRWLGRSESPRGTTR